MARRTSTLLTSSPALCSSAAWTPAVSYFKSCGPLQHLRGRLRYLKSCEHWQSGFPATSSTFASVLAYCPLSPSTHFEFISPVFCYCILSFPCSCIIQLSFSGSVFAPSFSPLCSPCSMCRRKTASCAIQPCEP